MDKRKQRAKAIYSFLQKTYGRPKTILRYSNEWELLVAVILSAQCTDVMVNKVTDKLFTKYKTIADYANAPFDEFATDIKSTGFYKNKAKNVIAAAQTILHQFGGNLPKTMEEMVTIPGVGRKTANVVLGNAFGIVEGIAVDTHVKRLAKRLGLTTHTDPVKIEKDLMALFDKKDWFQLTYLLIEHGRRICTARNHNHTLCLPKELSVR